MLSDAQYVNLCHRRSICQNLVEHTIFRCSNFLLFTMDFPFFVLFMQSQTLLPPGYLFLLTVLHHPYLEHQREGCHSSDTSEIHKRGKGHQQSVSIQFTILCSSVFTFREKCSCLSVFRTFLCSKPLLEHSTTHLHSTSYST